MADTGGVRSRRRPLLRGLLPAAVVAVVLVVLGVLTVHDIWGQPEQAGRTGGARTWLSGASGDGVADGTFGSWRGAQVPIAATWNDSADAQVNEWTLAPGAEYGDWQGDLDLAVGAIYADQGETWEQAAAGAYDDRWRSALTKIRDLRSGHTGTLYLRFAHEMNGEWEPWAVHGSDAADFVAAWRRFRALQLEILPDAELVFCPTAETSSSLELDWRTAFPGASFVDVVSVDFYNQYPYVSTKRAFDTRLGATDDHGAPRGLEAYREYAEQQGLPFAVSEWSSNADMGDGVAFIGAFHDWLQQHAGTGAGQVVYEIQFNVGGFGDGQFQLYPDTKQPEAASNYRRLF